MTTSPDTITIKGPFDVEDGVPDADEFEDFVLNMAGYRLYEGRVTQVSDGFVNFTIDNGTTTGQRRTFPMYRVHEIEWANR